MPLSLKFDVFGRDVLIVEKDGGWEAFYLGNEGKRRIAKDITVPSGITETDLAEAGTSIAYRAKPLVREKATYCLNYVGLDGVLNLFP